MDLSYKELFEDSLYLETEQWTKDTLAGLPTCRGVLLFTDRSGKPIQLLQAASLRRTAQAKLLREEEQTPTRKLDISELTHTLYWQCYHNDFLTQVHYFRMAHLLFADSPDDWIQLPRTSYAVIETDTFLPYFYVSEIPEMLPQRIVYGLFPTRKAVSEFAEILNTVFCLCRNPSLLKTGRESSCPYLQMQTCPGPCLDPAQTEAYRARVRQAIEAGSGRIDAAIADLQSRMKQASQTMAFERAQLLKKQTEQLGRLKRPDYQWTHCLKNLCILHVDQSGKVPVEGKKRLMRQYKWLKITSDRVYDLGDFVPQTREDVQRFLEENWTRSDVIDYADKPTEHLRNVSYFICRSHRSGFWLDCTNGIAADPLFAGLEGLFKLETTSEQAET